jgi:hypothetical protein
MRRGVANRTKVFKILPDSLIHGCREIPAGEAPLNYRRISGVSTEGFR